MNSFNVYAVGASRNIGYYAAIRLLNKGATVTFLLRNTSVFDDDADVQKYIASGHARLVKGDALNEADVGRGWDSAREDGRDVDVLLFTVGGFPNFTLTKGIVMNPPNLCTQALLNTLCTIPSSQRAPAAQPRIVVVSSTGITPASHANLPLVLRPVYAFIAAPHNDKLGMEKALAHWAGWPWEAGLSPHRDPSGMEILPEGWSSREGCPKEGELKKLVVVRPALLTDGRCMGDEAKEGKPPYLLAEGDLGRYTVSRRDVAHFIVEGALKDWEKWEGKGVSIAY